DDVAGPAADAGEGEHGGEEVELETDGVVRGGGVEVDVGVDALGADLAGHDLLDLGGHLVELEVAGVGGDLLAEGLEEGGAGVDGLVDAVAEAHDSGALVAALEAVHDEGLDGV